MTAPTEQQVLGAIGLKGLALGVEAVADLLVTLNYPDVAKELRLRMDESQSYWGED